MSSKELLKPGEICGASFEQLFKQYHQNLISLAGRLLWNQLNVLIRMMFLTSRCSFLNAEEVSLV